MAFRDLEQPVDLLAKCIVTRGCMGSRPNASVLSSSPTNIIQQCGWDSLSKFISTFSTLSDMFKGKVNYINWFYWASQEEPYFPSVQALLLHPPHGCRALPDSWYSTLTWYLHSPPTCAYHSKVLHCMGSCVVFWIIVSLLTQSRCLLAGKDLNLAQVGLCYCRVTVLYFRHCDRQ